MAQQTAVEWLIEQMTPYWLLEKSKAEEFIEQAKQMEKEQIYDSFCSGAWYENQNFKKSADNYYNEIYGK